MATTSEPAQGIAAAREVLAARLPDGGASIPDEDWADLAVTGVAVDSWRALIRQLLDRSEA
jgi:hypothetical protein